MPAAPQGAQQDRNSGIDNIGDTSGENKSTDEEGSHNVSSRPESSIR